LTAASESIQALVVVVARAVTLGFVLVVVVDLLVVVAVLLVGWVVVVAAVDEPERRAHVVGPTIPSALSPLAFWNEITADCVCAPKVPSVATLNPWAASAVWICRTPAPWSPSATLSDGLLTVRPGVDVAVDVTDPAGVVGTGEVRSVDVDAASVGTATVVIVAKGVGDGFVLVVGGIDEPLPQPTTAIIATSPAASQPAPATRPTAVTRTRRSCPVENLGARRAGKSSANRLGD